MCPEFVIFVTQKHNSNDLDNNLTIIHRAVTSALAARKPRKALALLRDMWAGAVKPAYALNRLESLESAYAMLERYALDGVADPERDRLFGETLGGIADLAASMMRESRVADDPSLYFGRVRIERLRRESLDDLAAQWRAAAPGRSREEALSRLFERVMVSYPLGADEAETVKALALEEDGYLAAYYSAALLLGALMWPDEARLLLLARIYMSLEGNTARVYPLVALIQSLAAWSAHTGGVTGRKLEAALTALAELPDATNDIMAAFMQLIRTRDTDRVNRKLNSELMPDLVKISRKLKDRIKDNPDAEDPDNPLWEEALEDSGLSKSLRELSELQADGADVLLGTFSHLKAFPFFTPPANWFLPFDPGHSALDDVRRIKGSLLNELGAIPILNDSDKYSMALLMATMPGQGSNESMLEQLRQQNEQSREEMEATLEMERLNVAGAANRYVQAIYRFFKLYSRRGEFADPFAITLNPLTTPLLREVITRDAVATLRLAAEFYFGRGYYPEAAGLFDWLERNDAPDSGLYQKAGVAWERLGETDRALQLYQNAELLAGDDPWTLRRIARLLLEDGRADEALDYYTRLEALEPDDAAAALGTARALAALERWDDALQKLAKPDYLLTGMEPDARRDSRLADTLRLMARAALYTRRPDKAAAAVKRLDALGMTPTSEDSAVAAVTALAQSRYRDAVTLLAQAGPGALAEWQPLLDQLHIDPVMLSIVTEAATDYNNTQQP